MSTVEDAMGAVAPAEYDGRDLKADGCPCGGEGFVEYPAGYYHCQDCWTEWAGDPENASLVHYFTPGGVRGE